MSTSKMTRRAFLKLGTFAGAGLAASPFLDRLSYGGEEITDESYKTKIREICEYIKVNGKPYSSGIEIPFDKIKLDDDDKDDRAEFSLIESGTWIRADFYPSKKDTKAWFNGGIRGGKSDKITFGNATLDEMKKYIDVVYREIKK